MSKESEVKQLMKERDAIQRKILALQKLCKHKEATFEYKANTGNYDPDADSYWKYWKCPACLKHWIEEY